MNIFITHLLKGQPYITTYRSSSIFKSATVSGFHNSRSSARHGSKTNLRNALSKFSCTLIVFIVFLKPRRTKYGNAGTYKVKRTKTHNKLFEHFPCKCQFVSTALRSV